MSVDSDVIMQKGWPAAKRVEERMSKVERTIRTPKESEKDLTQRRKERNVLTGSTMKLCVFAPLREIF